jgi:hypothetical protein
MVREVAELLDAPLMISVRHMPGGRVTLVERRCGREISKTEMST